MWWLQMSTGAEVYAGSSRGAVRLKQRKAMAGSKMLKDAFLLAIHGFYYSTHCRNET